MTASRLDNPRLPERVLVQLTFQIFLHVADADQTIDADELNQYMKLLNEPTFCQSKVAKRIFRLAGDSYPALAKQYAGGKIKKDFIEMTEAVKNADRILKEDEQTHFKEDLYRLGVEIAKASGKWFAKTSEEEKQVLSQLRTLLNIDT